MTYKIIRSRRKSISIAVTAENEIIVRCPLNMTERKVNDFVESKKLWVEKVVTENGKKLDLNADVTSYRKIYVVGEKLPLILSDKNLITTEGVYVKKLKQVKPLFIFEFSTPFIGYVNGLAAKYGFDAGEIKIKGYKSRWGCCDGKKNITFNYLLFMLPQSLQNYVIIHELCHTVYFNHSAKFWKLVSCYEPNYKFLRKQLKSFDFIINLY